MIVKSFITSTDTIDEDFTSVHMKRILLYKYKFLHWSWWKEKQKKTDS